MQNMLEEPIGSFNKDKLLGRVYIAFMCITPFLCAFIVECASNPTPELLRPLPMAIEILICALIELILTGFIPFYGIGLGLCYIFAMLFSLTNFYLLKFRDIPFMFMDLREAGTAFAVMSDYDFGIDKKVVLCLIITVLCVSISILLAPFFRRYVGKKYRYVISATVALFSISAMIILIGFIGFSKTFGIVMNLWKPGFTYAENGAISSFVCYAQFSSDRKPEGYDKGEVIKLLEEAEAEYDKSHKSLENDIRPTVISIMNESFSDFSAMGPMECTESHLKFYKSLKSDPGTIWHGYTYVSTYAGGTARTEFEWLTGYSMRSFSNAQPYSQFNFKNIMTSVRNFLNAGYETVAMHPEAHTNYRRNTAYEQMGFDKFLSKDDFKGYEESDLEVGRTTDKGDFDRMTDEDEASDKPQFFHNVTMQNHGGFEFYLDADRAVKVDSEYSKYKSFVKFETLLAQTDKALEELIEYYKNIDEPTIICFYGDHFPNMPEEMVTDLMLKGYDENKSTVENEERRFKIPFFIWANYDVGEHITGYAMNGELITSPNYLGVVTRADAGMKLSAFDKYLLLLREKIPVINESGYVAGDKWHASDEENEYTKLLDQYKCVQYAGMFDNDGIENLFGGSIDGKE